MIYLAKGGSWLTLGQVIGVLFGVILTLGFANLLTQDSYGTYKYVLSVTGFIAAFSLTGIGTAVTMATAQGYKNVLRIGFISNVKWSIPMAIIGTGTSLYYLVMGNVVLAVSIFIAVFFTISLNSTNLFAAYLRGKKEFKKETLYGFAISIIPPMILLGTIVVTNNVIIIISVYFISISGTSFILFLKTMRATENKEDEKCQGSVKS